MKNIILACVILLLTACSTLFPNKEDNNISKGEKMEYRELTAEQEALLCDISVNEKKIKEGNLYSWQIEVLYQYDFALEYLKEKYPSYSFKIIKCDPKNKMNSYTMFSFVEETEPDCCFDCYLYVEDDRYRASDNFYGHLFEKEYEKYILELLQKNNICNAKINTSIVSVQGMEFCERMDLTPVFQGEIKLPQRTEIYFQYENINALEDMAATIKAVIVEENIYGSYQIKIYDEVNKTIYEENFNTF